MKKNNIYRYSDKEVDIELVVNRMEFDKIDKNNISFEFKVNGDMLHHTVEGMCTIIRKVLQDNCHLVELEEFARRYKDEYDFFCYKKHMR